MLAALIPFSAVLLLGATTRSKTEQTACGSRDASGGADRDAWPGIGMDDTTPLGDTPEHSDERSERTR
jgi:hypothetical protein